MITSIGNTLFRARPDQKWGGIIGLASLLHSWHWVLFKFTSDEWAWPWIPKRDRGLCRPGGKRHNCKNPSETYFKLKRAYPHLFANVLRSWKSTLRDKFLTSLIFVTKEMGRIPPAFNQNIWSFVMQCALYKYNNNIFHIIPQHSIWNCKSANFLSEHQRISGPLIIKFFNELLQKQSLFHCNAEGHQGILMLCRGPTNFDLSQKET